ncbi:MgtC/SapB family protein [Rubellimicrobium sp. CFH 75288]|uniref:MgtC/SapB family protein n=1 Tax=Rubellimicrobium sp. CFH 75288 TaxID=2697034 RepID=UPI001412A68E|nr:MgtC/SapB family protein [Rubellimicrobium sp. CFH 75288]NAZ35208.1 MgtC/SapB family protein [Rubellimicrobium sp. CFH 75288]
MTVAAAALHLVAALVFGALIGAERQWRQRLAGLRTNTLVALGAASFVVFSAAFPDEVSPTRVAAQVVSGIGFLGAGIIFREGLNVRGLNTAATLWCSAAVGVMAGAGAIALAALVTALVIFVNLALRPLVIRLNRQPIETTELPQVLSCSVVCRAPHEAHVRAMMLADFAANGLHLSALTSENIEGSDRVEVTAEVTAPNTPSGVLEQIVGRLSLDPAVTAARWRRAT